MTLPPLAAASRANYAANERMALILEFNRGTRRARTADLDRRCVVCGRWRHNNASGAGACNRAFCKEVARGRRREHSPEPTPTRLLDGIGVEPVDGGTGLTPRTRPAATATSP